MEVRKPKIKSMKYEDFTDNEYLEKMIEELRANGTNVVMGCLDEVINWGRSNSLWPLTFATSCCGIEFMAVGAARYDFARFGFEVARASPRQADFIMVAGTITHKMAPVLRRLRGGELLWYTAVILLAITYILFTILPPSGALFTEPGDVSAMAPIPF